MDKEISVLRRLDKSTLRFLSDNTRIADFSSDLQHRLKQAYESADTTRGCLPPPRSPVGGVSFQADTDNRKNFPNDKSFHQFKKQRDVFYEVIREWENRHQSAGWSLVEMQGERIRWLVTYRTDLTNHLHFARLFLSQLIVMCKGDNSVKTDGDEQTISLLAQLKRTNPDKFKKLQERFIKPFSFGGPSPPPGFPGYQEFFRDFILAAGNAVFNQHLTNTLVARVTTLNSTEFEGRGQREVKSTSSEPEEEEDQQHLFASCLLTLRLLGKFLGFVTFLPYQTPDLLPDSFRSEYLTQRNQVPAPLHLVHIIHNAVQCRRLVLAVPWIVEFASQMDHLAPTLDSYEPLLAYLQLVLSLSWQRVQKDSCYYGNLMIVVLITWLFDNSAMPDGLFFKEFDMEKLIAECPSSDVHSLHPLDDWDLVTQDILYTCCPYIGEMRNLLMEFAMGTNSRGTIRKITPTAASTSQPTTYTHKQLQSQLEENFFHNHPASLRRTVEFVSERTASNFIKKFRSSILPRQLMTAKTEVGALRTKLRQQEPEKRKMGQEQEETVKLVPKVMAEITTEVTTLQREFCENKTLASLKELLPEEQSESVVAMAASIACTIAELRIFNWVTKHVTAAVVQSELLGSVEKILCTHLLMGDYSLYLNPKPQPRFDAHLEHARGLSDIISDLKDQTGRLLLEDTSSFNVDSCLSLLDEADTALRERQDLVPLVVKATAQIIFNLAVTAVIRSPGVMSSRISDKCVWLWKRDLGRETEFDGICCNRVVHALSSSPHPQACWSSYSELIVSLLEEKTLQPEVFRDGCRKVIKSAKLFHINLEPLGRVVCDIFQHFSQSESITSCLCRTLEQLFHQSEEGSHLARIILPLLDKYVPLDSSSKQEGTEDSNLLCAETREIVCQSNTNEVTDTHQRLSSTDSIGDSHNITSVNKEFSKMTTNNHRLNDKDVANKENNNTDSMINILEDHTS